MFRALSDPGVDGDDLGQLIGKVAAEDRVVRAAIALLDDESPAIRAELTYATLQVLEDRRRDRLARLGFGLLSPIEQYQREGR